MALLLQLLRRKLSSTPDELGLDYRDVCFPSRADHVRLRGWLLPAPRSDRIVVLLHGAFMNRADRWVKALWVARDLVRHGFNVLTFDLRACGLSEGARMGLGYWEWRDALGALDFLKSAGFRAGKVGFLGYSAGGVAAILAAAREPEVRAFVSDSAYADGKEVVESYLARVTRIPRRALAPLILAGRALSGLPLATLQPEAVVRGVKPRRVLFIHGECDDMVPTSHARRLHAAAANPDNGLWIVPGARHVATYAAAPEEYISRVVAFFREELF